MNDNAVRSALHGAQDLARRPRFWGGLAALIFMLGLVGPFGTYDALSVAARMFYWSAICIPGFWLGYLTSALVAVSAEGRGIRSAVAVALGGLAAALPITGVVAVIDHLVFGAAVLPRVADLLPVVAILSVVIATLFEALDARDVPAVPDRPSADEPRWLDRLPATLGRDLITLQAQDHYVAARTAAGETLLRASLNDAAADLGDYGVRVHRSWWVARHWIERLKTKNGQLIVVLRDATEVPVGRVYRASVRQRLQQR